MTDLTELLERVKAATGADREIDAAIWAAVQGVRLTVFTTTQNGYCHGWDGDLRYPDWPGVGTFTASLDAALALVERVLPGWCWYRLKAGTMWLAPDDVSAGYGGAGKTPALALLAALLTALTAQDDVGGDHG